jgi:hypothetical protein
LAVIFIEEQVFSGRHGRQQTFFAAGRENRTSKQEKIRSARARNGSIRAGFSLGPRGGLGFDPVVLAVAFFNERKAVATDD